MDFVSDTNVWYDIGNGRIDVSKLRADGAKLYATAISAIELSSRMTDRDFPFRKKAAQAVIDYADGYLGAPGYHVSQLWRMNVPQPKIKWKDVFLAISLASDMENLIAGVENIMKIDVEAATLRRVAFSDEFVAIVTSVIRNFFPDYATGRESGRGMHYASQQEAAQIKTLLAKPTMHEAFAQNSRDWVKVLSPSAQLVDASESEVEEVMPLLLPYAKAYSAYLVKAVTASAPQRNDWGDLHCFVYIQQGRKLLTAEKKWLEIAKDAGLQDDVVDSKLFLS
jgi:hypothetical protein